MAVRVVLLVARRQLLVWLSHSRLQRGSSTPDSRVNDACEQATRSRQCSTANASGSHAVTRPTGPGPFKLDEFNVANLNVRIMMMCPRSNGNLRLIGAHTLTVALIAATGSESLAVGHYNHDAYKLMDVRYG